MLARCSICLELFDGSSVVATPCGHTFHSTCINQWLRMRKCCPSCDQSTVPKKLMRVFFDIAFGAEADSADRLRKLNDTSIELQISKHRLNEAELKLAAVAKDNKQLRQIGKKAKKEVYKSKTVISDLKAANTTLKVSLLGQSRKQEVYQNWYDNKNREWVMEQENNIRLMNRNKWLDRELQMYMNLCLEHNRERVIERNRLMAINKNLVLLIIMLFIVCWLLYRFLANHFGLDSYGSFYHFFKNYNYMRAMENHRKGLCFRWEYREMF